MPPPLRDRAYPVLVSDPKDTALYWFVRLRADGA